MKRRHDGLHRRWVADLPCVSCLNDVAGEAAHIRYGDKRAGKRAVGMGETADDEWTVPLCGNCHRTGPEAQHKSNERNWWAKKGIDPVKLAAALVIHRISGDREAAERAIRAHHE